VAFFDVTFQTRASLHPGGEPSDYVAEYHGVVRCERDRDGRRRRHGGCFMAASVGPPTRKRRNPRTRRAPGV
jgi:hypothetical protein